MFENMAHIPAGPGSSRVADAVTISSNNHLHIHMFSIHTETQMGKIARFCQLNSRLVRRSLLADFDVLNPLVLTAVFLARFSGVINRFTTRIDSK